MFSKYVTDNLSVLNFNFYGTDSFESVTFNTRTTENAGHPSDPAFSVYFLAI